MIDSSQTDRQRLLLLFAHPALHKSRVNRALLAAAQQVDGVTVNDLYEVYPEFDIDVAREQAPRSDRRGPPP